MKLRWSLKDGGTPDHKLACISYATFSQDFSLKRKTMERMEDQLYWSWGQQWKYFDTQQFRSRKRKNDLCGKWEHGPDPVITNHAFGSCPCKLNSEGVAQVSLEMGGWRDEPSSWAELFWDNLQRLWIPQHLLLYSKMPSLPGWKFCLMTHALLCTKTPIAMSLWCCTW